VEVAFGDRDASVLEPALLRPPRGPARLALLNLGLVGLLEVRLDDRAVELPADTFLLLFLINNFEEH
jgi:hypothetical protein